MRTKPSGSPLAWRLFEGCSRQPSSPVPLPTPVHAVGTAQAHLLQDPTGSLSCFSKPHLKTSLPPNAALVLPPVLPASPAFWRRLKNSNKDDKSSCLLSVSVEGAVLSIPHALSSVIFSLLRWGRHCYFHSHLKDEATEGHALKTIKGEMLVQSEASQNSSSILPVIPGCRILGLTFPEAHKYLSILIALRSHLLLTCRALVGKTVFKRKW